MNKHSPGPWKVQSEFEPIYVTSDEGIDIAYCPGDKQGLVDANLIAAAPELLDALESFPGFLADTSNGDEWIEKMRSAIAKARGES